MDHDQPEIEHDTHFWDAPSDTSNYVTPAGFTRMQQELDTLLQVVRPAIVAGFASVVHTHGLFDRLSVQQRLSEIDGRIDFLTNRLRLAEVVDPCHQRNRDQVFFGAMVTYVDGRGEERTIRILGADEADPQLGEVSLQSPMARALLLCRDGDTVSMTTQAGREAVDVLEIHYPSGYGR